MRRATVSFLGIVTIANSVLAVLDVISASTWFPTAMLALLFSAWISRQPAPDA